MLKRREQSTISKQSTVGEKGPIFIYNREIFSFACLYFEENFNRSLSKYYTAADYNINLKDESVGCNILITSSPDNCPLNRKEIQKYKVVVIYCFFCLSHCYPTLVKNTNRDNFVYGKNTIYSDKINPFAARFERDLQTFLEKRGVDMENINLLNYIGAKPEDVKRFKDICIAVEKLLK
ncbi:MAG: hypothetical protein ACRYGG_14590 [Janthinobacterium lividum]